MSIKKETIHGFDIEKRELTEEEKTRQITLDVIKEFHGNAGEDLMDQAGSLVDHKVLAGFLIGKRPGLSKEFLKVVNSKYGEALGLLEVYRDNDLDDVDFYNDFCDFINLTEKAKERFNQILIQVNEYYKD